MVNGTVIYAAVIGVTVLERLVELIVARRNAAWSFAHGGIEYGSGHYPWMVAMHAAFLVSCVAEPVLLQRSFIPEVAWTCIVIAVLSQLLRWWVIFTLGYQWNTRVIIVPELQRITSGPFRYLSHPNYIAVITEILVLPLIHGGWLTAIVFSLLNARLLSIRIRCENDALGRFTPHEQ